jgi:hypothetical protein
MPLHDSTIHKKVLEDMRSIVTLFSSASKNDSSSPAFLQLQRTISEVQQVIQEIDGDNNE